MLSIGAFSRLCQVSIKTLRFYHEIGLFVPAHIDRSSGYRYYVAGQLNDIRSILAFKSMGFSLDEIETLVRESMPANRMRDLLLEKRAETKAIVHEARGRARQINAAIDQIERGWQIGGDSLVVKKLPRQLVAGIRSVVPSYDTAAALLDELGHFAKRRGAHATVGAIWHSCGIGGAQIDCEVIAFLDVPLEKSVPRDRRLRVYELPALTVAGAVYQGNADFNQSYLSANKWIAANGWRRVGPNRELYLRGGYSDSESALMEIQFPVEPKTPLQPKDKNSIP